MISFSHFRLNQLTLLLLCWRHLAPTSSVRVIETNSFRSEKASGYLQQPSDNYREEKQPRYVDSSELRYDENPGPFFPIQFPSPIKYDQSNAIRYQMIERDNTQTQFGKFDLGNIDIGGELDSEEADDEGPAPPPLISADRDIEIYQNPGRLPPPYSGESIELEMFDLPEDVFYSDSPVENHPG